MRELRKDQITNDAGDAPNYVDVTTSFEGGAVETARLRRFLLVGIEELAVPRPDGLAQFHMQMLGSPQEMLQLVNSLLKGLQQYGVTAESVLAFHMLQRQGVDVSPAQVLDAPVFEVDHSPIHTAFGQGDPHIN